MKRFQMITEADARALDYGSTVVLVAGGHVTPLAQDTLKARRISIVRDGQDVDAESLAPKADIRTLAIASDHSGVALKKAILQHLRGRGIAVHDLGTNTSEPVDYPDTAGAAAVQVSRGEADAAIVIDGAGLGSTIAANKVNGVRAAMCLNQTLARYAREHNGGGAHQRRDVYQHADAGGALHPAAGEDSESRVMQTPDIQRLIQIIIEELAAAGHAPATERCSCHSVLSECCPDRLRGILDAGATRLGLHAAGGATGGVALMIDHTLLKPDATPQEIETLW